MTRLGSSVSGLRSAAVAASLVLLVCAVARAGDEVSARLVSPFAFDDGDVRVLVEIGRTDEDVVGADLAVPDGFRAEGPYGGARRTTIVNGVSSTVTEVEFRVTPPAGAKGTFDIGPVRLKKRSGEVVTVPVGPLLVGRRPEPGVRFEVRAEPPGGPVMMPFVARYRVVYSGRVDEGEDVFGSSRNPFGLTSLSIPLLDRSDVKVTSEPGGEGEEAGTVRLSDLVLHVRRGFEEIDGAIYRTLDFALRITPLATGQIDLSAEVGMALVTSVEKRRDFFGRVVEVPVAKSHPARTGPAVYRVAELPAEGRPKGFTGAVGRFTIEADPEPREVNAFDPIEVTVTVRGTGVLERLSLPRWSADEDITRDFELDADLDPGKVEDGAKVFRVVFRARSSAVSRLPALPFPYYDPELRRYEVARSEPVPLAVRDVKTVRPEDAVGAPAAATPEPAGAPTPIGRRLSIGANFETLDEGVGTLAAAPPLFTPGFLLLLVLPPALAAVLLLLDRARSRPRDLPRGTPLSRALSGLGAAPAPDAAAEVFAGYFRERAELPEGEITTPELTRALLARSVPPAVVERVAAAHAALVSARFAGGEAPADLGDVLREADRCLG